MHAELTISTLRERQLRCMFCSFRDRKSADRWTCKASGKSALTHAEENDCPKDRFPRIVPPKDDAETQSYIDGPFKPLPLGWSQLPQVQAAYRAALAAQKFDATYTGSGRGLVIPAGGRYALVGLLSLELIRHAGCKLPCEIWRLPDEPLEDWQQKAAEGLGVTFRQPSQPMRNPHGWALKTQSLLETDFEEVIFRDSDCYDLSDPEQLFDSAPYRDTGALFWPDPPKYNLLPEVWSAMGIPFRWEPTFEAGQFTVDRKRCWHELQVANWMNQHAEYYWLLGPREPKDINGYFGQGIYGDKDCFHLAWRYCGSEYGIAPRTYEHADPAVTHFDLDAKTVRIIHRIHGKAVLQASDATFLSWQKNERNDALPNEVLYWHYLDELRAIAPKPPEPRQPAPSAFTGYDGSAVWQKIHGLTDLATAAQDIAHMLDSLPCGICQTKAIRYIKANPVDESSLPALRRWSWAWHNDVNRSIGKPEMSWEDTCKQHGWPTN